MMTSILEILLFVVALVIMFVGLAGVIIPVLPGVPLIFGAAVLYGILTGFENIGLRVILILGGFTAAALVVDYLANFLSVRKMGGSIAGAVGAVVGLIVGIFFGLIWIIVLPFIFAVSLELIAGREAHQALRSGFGSLIGLVFGGLTRVVIGCVMIGIFVWKVLF